MTATSQPDPTLAASSSASTSAGTSDRKRWSALAFLSLGVAMVMIDSTIINVSIPQISRDLALTPSDIEWVNSIYALVFAALLITMGKAGDIFGRRLLFVLGACVFLASSLIAARSNSGEVLILGRFFQGIGGAMMIPASLSLLNSMFRGKDRAVAFAVWGATIGAVGAIGPLIGGFLTTSFSWRWAFLINLPLTILLVVGALLLVPESKEPDAERGIDVVGVLTSAVGLGALVFALIEGQRYGWLSTLGTPKLGGLDWTAPVSPVPIAAVLAVVLLTTFVLVERGRAQAGKVVILDLELFAIRSFAWGQVVAMLIMFGEFGIILMLPLFLQNVLGFSAVHAGATLAFIMIGALVSTPPSGALVGRFGAIMVVRIGLLLEVVSMAGLGFAYSVGSNTWTLAPWLTAFGMGIGLSTAQITNVILREVPVEKSGQASGTQSTSRQLGVALGVAVLGAALWISLANILDARLGQQPGISSVQAQRVTTQVVNSSGVALDGLRAAQPEIGAIADQAYTDSTRRATWVASGFLLIALAGTFRMKPSHPVSGRREEPIATEPGAEDERTTAERS